MYCRHCSEEIEPRLCDDPAARCSACDQMLADLPEGFRALSAGTTPAEDLAAVERVVAALQRRSPDLFVLPQRAAASPSNAINPPTPLVSSPLPPPPVALSPAVQAMLMPTLPEMPAESSAGATMAWLVLGLGLATFACGGVLLVWAAFGGRHDLWSIGFPLTLAGQGAIIFGLVGLAETSRQRECKLQMVLREQREQLEIQQQWTMLNAQLQPTTSQAQDISSQQLRMQWELLRQMRATRAA